MQKKQKRFKLSQKDSLNLFFRILQLIQNKKKGFFSFKKIRGSVHGYCDWEEGIVIDHRKEIIPTLIHECIHYLEPEWSEKNVIEAEKKILKYIEPEDAICLIKIFCKKI